MALRYTPLVATDDVTRLRGGEDETRLAPDGPAPAHASSGSRIPTSSSGWLTSADTFDHGRFTPGTVLGGRYRIVERLGRGGMGEVYRADDLKVGQPVALKFLPAEVDRDPVRLTQLHTEVRMARQVSHPNVCRVYDIDEVDGHTFLSMEYVDGEELASLLRRIGRFPAERAVQLAQQICAGLAAAHERGVIHRDLKPANVMLDGTGKVRITDFGLAGATGESIRAGTPAYMAPEQLAGSEVTARSDIYSLGLVLYELFTGQRAVEGKNLAELIHKREESGVIPPSQIVRDLDPAVDRATLRCLAPEPAHRPASALAVAAALPGGDPLAAALAAGETPSPAMVAAAGESGGLSRLAGTALLTFVAVGPIVLALVCDRVLLVNRISPPKPADVLEERAREIIAAAGYTDAPVDTARGAVINHEYLSWIERTDASASRWDFLPAGSAPVLRFWYRTSPGALNPVSLTAWTPQLNDPPLALSGMISVVVDDRGRLLEFVTMPPQFDPTPPPAATVDWKPLFTAAGLPFEAFSEVAPHWTPRIYAEQRVAWEGPMPAKSGVKLRVEAASYGGRPVAFQIVGPWTRPVRMEQPAASPIQRALSAAATMVAIALMVGAIVLARYSVRSGRADLRGANRITLFVMAIWIAAWAIGARHTLVVEDEINRFFSFIALALLNVGLTWIFYLGLEPFVRRFCPDVLITWTRLLSGRVRDPQVGRDLLIGVAAGVLFGLLSAANAVAPAFAAAPPPQPEASNVQYFLGSRFAIAALLRVLPNALQGAMLATFTYVMLLAMARRRSVATALAGLLFVAVLLADSDTGAIWRALLFGAAIAIPAFFVFLRYGLLATATAMVTNQILNVVPLTGDLTRPHAAISSFALLLLAGAAAYGFYASRAGSGLFRRLVPA